MAAMTAPPPVTNLPHSTPLSRPIQPLLSGHAHRDSAANSQGGAAIRYEPPGPPPSHSPPQAPKSHFSQFYVNGGPERANSANSPSKNGLPVNFVPDPRFLQMAAASPVYSAHYSGIHVYEMTVNTVAVMRRRADSWLNATQILKVAGVEKGRRTKALEREILSGEHEKVQGGYGKYQGTWINYRRGVEFCRSYGVENLLRPLLEYDMGPEGQREILKTPTKEQAMAAHRKRQYSLETARKAGPLFKSLSSEASQTVQAMAQLRQQTAGSAQSSFNSNYSGSTGSSILHGSQDTIPLSQQSFMSTDSTQSFRLTGSNDSDHYSSHSTARAFSDPTDGPPLKRFKASQFEGSADMSQSQQSSVDSQMTDSFQSQDSFVTNASSVSATVSPGPAALPPVPVPETQDEERQQQQLRLLFYPLQNDDTNYDSMLNTLTLPEFDYPMDNRANAALSWAAAMGNIPLLKALIKKGASIFRVNEDGETALMRACSSINNFEKQTFAQLLELLGPTIDMRDNERRSILHHITLTAGVLARSKASRYYLESLLEFVVRQGTPPSSFTSQPDEDATGADDPNAATIPPRIITFWRLQTELVDARDIKGDTALNMAARTNNTVIIEQLLELGANPLIPNKSQLRPIDFGVDPKMLENDHGAKAIEEAPEEDSSAGAARDAESSFSRVIQEHAYQFSAELSRSHLKLDATRTKIRTTAVASTELSRQIQVQRQIHKERSQRKIKISNLRRALEEMKNRRQSREASLRLQPVSIMKYKPVKIDRSSLPLQERIVTDEVRSYLSTLPSKGDLKARIDAHKALLARTSSELRKLDLKSIDREKAYRKLLAVCRGCEEDAVDGLVPQFSKAVKGEDDSETPEVDWNTRLTELMGDLGSSSRSDTPRSLN